MIKIKHISRIYAPIFFNSKKAFLVLFCIFPFHAMGLMDGLYSISGTMVNESTLENYKGQIWLHEDQVQRIVQNENKLPNFNNQKLELVWLGRKKNETLSFELKYSNLLTEFETYKIPEENSEIEVKVILPSDENNNTIHFQLGDQSYTETWRRIGPDQSEPLYIDRRQTSDATGNSSGLLISLARWIGIDLVVDWYRKQPELKPYQEREEVISAKQSYVTDFSDLEFYRQNPGVLRLINKVINPLAIAEAQMRQNAFSKTLSQKEGELRQETLKYNLNAAGMLEIAKINKETGEKSGFIPEGDSALWTGMLGWSEFLRFQQTSEIAALRNFENILLAEMDLVDITLDSKEFARALAVSPPSENLGENWVQGQGVYKNLKWLRGGNNDMYKGLILTLTLAYKVKNQIRPAIAERARQIAKKLIYLKIGEGSGFNAGIAHGLLALWNHDFEHYEIYSKDLTNLISLMSDCVGAESGFYWGGIADWSGIHLAAVSNTVAIVLSEELSAAFQNGGQNYMADRVRARSLKLLKKMQQVYHNLHRDFLTVLVSYFSSKAERVQMFEQEQESQRALIEVPSPRYIGNGAIDLYKISSWSLSAWPNLPWKSIGGLRKLSADIVFRRHQQGAYAYPLFESSAWGSTYLWKDAPFAANYRAENGRINFSADYLLLYRLALAAGAISARD